MLDVWCAGCNLKVSWSCKLLQSAGWCFESSAKALSGSTWCKQRLSRGSDSQSQQYFCYQVFTAATKSQQCQAHAAITWDSVQLRAMKKFLHMSFCFSILEYSRDHRVQQGEYSTDDFDICTVVELGIQAKCSRHCACAWNTIAAGLYKHVS